VADFPDWTRATLISGKDGSGNIVPILVDEAGQINILVRGDDGTGTVRTVRVDSLGQLYTVLRGAGGVDIAVDANGNLSAVLKGQYAGDLHVIAVDAQGRIEAFGLDSEDQWGQTLCIGNAELAGRLQSPKAWDWRGNVYYQNDFRHGIGNVLKYGGGTGTAIALNATYWINGGYSLKLTGGSDGNLDAYINVLLDHPPSDRLGLEAFFSCTTDFDYIYLKLILYKAGKIYHAGLMLDSVAPPSVKYINSAGVWTTIGTSFVGVSINAFNHMKIVADFSTFKYIRAMWGDTEYDLSAQSVYQPSTGYLNQMIAEFYLKSRSGHNDVCYLDYLICTVGEPD